MPDQDVPHAADPGERDESGTNEDLQDRDLRDEIELVADLVVAASAADGPLSLDEIDRILGVGQG